MECLNLKDITIAVPRTVRTIPTTTAALYSSGGAGPVSNS